MRFRQFVQNTGKKQSVDSLASLFTDVYLVAEFAKQYSFLQPADYDAVETLRAAAARDYAAAADDPARVIVLKALLTGLDTLSGDLVTHIERRELEAKTVKEGRIALARAATPVQVEERINGDRVLHFTTAIRPIIATDKLRISASSDQGCVFCIPARYAPFISTEPPARVKQMFDIRQDLSHYVEFNLEDSRGFESFNSHIDESLRGQKELKVRQEILNLRRRNPQWYEWRGPLGGGWVLVPGPYAWGVAI